MASYPNCTIAENHQQESDCQVILQEFTKPKNMLGLNQGAGAMVLYFPRVYYNYIQYDTQGLGGL